MNDREDTELDALAAIVARKLAIQGNTLGVRILAEGHVEAELLDVFSTEFQTYTSVSLRICVPQATWLLLDQKRFGLQRDLTSLFGELTESSEMVVQNVSIQPELNDDISWHDSAANWLRTEGVTNQGRARSTNIAPIEHDGLLFRSRAEVNLYDALKKTGITFAPLPVFIRGGADFRRIEPDFIIISKGIVLHVEIDGDTIDHGTPLEADRRISILKPEGVITERVSASECSSPELANGCADKLVRLIDRLKASR